MPDPRLVVFFARVGDLVMLTPLLRALAADGPVEVLARPWAAPLLAGQPGIAAVHTLGKPNRGAVGEWFGGRPRTTLGRALAVRPWRELVTVSRETPILQAWLDRTFAGVPRRSLAEHGFGRDRARHVVDDLRFAALAAGVAAEALPAEPVLAVSPAALERARQRLAPLGRRVVAIQAGSSLTHRWFRRQVNVKGLEPAQWSRLLGRISDRGEADAFVLHGSRPERREAQAIIAALPPALRGRVHDWTGAVGLADLPAVMAAHAACLSVDTGPAHIAAAVGTPLLEFFGPTDPARFRARGPGPIELLLGSAPCQFCHGTRLFRTCRRNACLRDLPEAAIAAGWDRLAARIPR